MIIDDPLVDAAPDASADAIAQRLRPIWRRIFGPKGQNDNAHIMTISIGIGRMTRFLDAVETELGTRIPITALMRLGTIDALATAIATRTWPDPSPLVRLREGTPDHTLYVVAAGTGLVLELCDLASLIHTTGTIDALQLPGLDGETTPLTSITAIARHYADTIAARPGHTCHLIGYSFGGLVCVEIARHLNPATHPIGLVGLIDTTCYERYWPRREWLRVATNRLLRRLNETRQMPPHAALQHFASRTRALQRHLLRRTNNTPNVTSSVYYVGGLTPTLQTVRDASIIAFETHNPQPTTIPLTLFQSDQGDQHGCNPTTLWHHLTPHLETIPIPGSHITMLRKPHVQTLALAISDRMVGAGDLEAKKARGSAPGPRWGLRPQTPTV